MVITTAFALTCIALVVIYFVAGYSTVSYVQSQNSSEGNSNNTLSGNLNASVGYLSDFLNTGIKDGSTATTSTVTLFVDQTKEKINGEVPSTLENILNQLDLSKALGQDGAAITNLDEYVQLIKSTEDKITNKISNDVDKLENSLNGAKMSLQSGFNDINDCDQKPECSELKGRVSNLESPLSSTAINAEFLKTLADKLEQFKTEFQTQFNKVQEAAKNVKDSASEIANQIDQQLNIESVVSQVNNFWTNAGDQSSVFINDFSNTVQQVDSYASKYSPYVEIGFYVLGGIFILLTLVGFILAILLLCRARSDDLCSSEPNYIEHSNVQIGCICSRWSICFCSVISIPLILIGAAIIALLLFTLTTISGEGCIYLYKQGAINQADYVVNKIVADQWSSTGSSGQTSLLNTPPPKNLLEAFNVKCAAASQTENVGFLSAVGYTNLMNVEALINDQKVTGALNQGKGLVVEEVNKNLDPQSLPTSADIENLKQSLEQALGNIDVQTLINALEPDAKKLTELKDYQRDLTKYLENNPNMVLQDGKSYLDSALENMDTINQELPGVKNNLEQIQQKASSLKTQFMNILNPISNAINIISDKTQFSNIVNQNADKMVTNLTDFLKSKAENDFAALTTTLFPCSKANKAYNAIVGSTCGNQGAINLLLGSSYILALNVLFISLLYLSLFILAFVQEARIQMFRYESGDFDDDDKTFSIAFDDETISGYSI